MDFDSQRFTVNDLDSAIGETKRRNHRIKSSFDTTGGKSQDRFEVAKSPIEGNNQYSDNFYDSNYYYDDDYASQDEENVSENEKKSDPDDLPTVQFDSDDGTLALPEYSQTTESTTKNSNN